MDSGIGKEFRFIIMPVRDKTRPTRLLFVQTQAEMAGAQEISRILGAGLSRPGPAGEPACEVHHLFLYRKSPGCDDFPNVHFAATEKPRSPLDAIRFLFRLVSLLRRIDADVVLPFQHYGNIVTAPLARLLGKRRIIANHVSAPATISGPVRLVDKWLGLLGFYDVMTVNSHATWHDYMAYPPRYRNRIVYVPHGFSRKTPTLDKAGARRHFGIPGDVTLLGTVARLHPLKRIDLAIGQLVHLPDLHLAIAGQGPDGERLRAIANALKVQDRVHFLGELHPDEIGNVLACLDIFVFPSAAETFGLAAVEAADAGVPVIATDMPVMREVLRVDGEDCAVFADVTDPAAFTRAIRALTGDPAARERLSHLGRRLGAQHSLDAMVGCYRNLIEGRPVAPAKSGRATAPGGMAHMADIPP